MAKVSKRKLRDKELTIKNQQLKDQRKKGALKRMCRNAKKDVNISKTIRKNMIGSDAKQHIEPYRMNIRRSGSK